MTAPSNDRLFDHIDQIIHGQQSPDCGRWLSRGLQLYIQGEPLERALGLNTASAQGARACYRLLQRDRHLRRAAALLTGANPAAAQLGDAIAKFSTRVWPRWKTFTEPPPDASALYRELFHASRWADGRLPCSTRQIRRILATSCRDIG